LHPRFFAPVVALALLVAGCRKSSAPGYERLRAQLLREAFDALNGRAPDRAQILLGRLEDLSPDQPFWRLASAHEEERGRLTELNRLVETGRFEEASAYVRSQTTETGASGALARATGLPEALQALRVYVNAPAPTTSRTARNALQSLESHSAVLTVSPTFVRWQQAEMSKYVAMRDSEQTERVTRLLSTYDQAVVTGMDTEAALKQFRKEAPEHPIVSFGEQVRKGRWSDLVKAAQQPGDGRAAIEILACQHWPNLPQRVSSWAGRATAPYRTTAGALVHALVRAERGDLAPTRGVLTELGEELQLADRYTSYFLEVGVLPRGQFTASCWRAPCPSVTDILNRIVQVREHSQAKGK